MSVDLSALVAHPRFRFMPGMLITPAPDPDAGEDCDPADCPRVVSVRGGCVTVAWEAGAGDADGGTLMRGDIPDLSDPATVGCLAALVREVWAAPGAQVTPWIALVDVGKNGVMGWRCALNDIATDREFPPRGSGAMADTEGEAWALALMGAA